MLSTELAIKKKPVRVNAIAPGPFSTEMTESQGIILIELQAHLTFDRQNHGTMDGG